MTTRWKLIAGAAMAVALAAVATAVTVILTRPTTTVLTVAAPTPSPTTDIRGEKACKDLEKQQAKPFKDVDTYASELKPIAIAGKQATDEDVREQSEILWDLLVRWGTDSNVNGLDVERQVLDVIRACDDANYAF